MLHIPVLVEEILSYLEKMHLFSVLDGTCGAGGHAHSILSKNPTIKQYVALDQDCSALAIAQKNLVDFQEKTVFLHRNFSSPPEDFGLFDMILIDIGVSSMQIDQGQRGFSFMKEGPLDMRMDQTQECTAADLVNTLHQQKLLQILYDGGVERGAKMIAKAITERRRKKPFATTTDLADFISTLIPRHGKTHPATVVFQALRLAVNQELHHLEEALPRLCSLLSPNGRLFVITFHSLEDRIVKNIFKSQVATGNFQLVVKKPIVPSLQEIRKNPRSRSAKLRILEKIAQ